MRRRAYVLLHEEDLHYLLALEPGERVIGAWADPMRMGIRIGVEGDESTGLPETVKGSEAHKIDRPYAMHRLRDRLADVMSGSWRNSRSPEDYHKAVTEAVEREVWPHLNRSVP